MPGVFVTATGTGVGKTYVTAARVRALRAAGKPARALKPVISGWDDDPDAIARSDTGILLAAQGLAATPANIEACSPFRFIEPLSPDMAARRESRDIDFDRLVGMCREAVENTGNDETLFIEGVGGVMVPLTDRHTVLDWMAALNLPVILVAGSYLGTISHTLTAARVLRDRGLEIQSIVISESEESPVPCEETVQVIGRHLQGKTVEIVERGGALSKHPAVNGANYCS